MCGIIGYKGKNSAVEVLLKGLKNLEYRGYDSAGVALTKNNELKVIKSVGKISKLEEKINNENLDTYNIGIAHTRWATNGGVTLENAHPHTVGKVTLVHNGIIENADELKKELQSEGVVFNSDTDTEVVAAIINKYLENDVISSLTNALKNLKGSYALGIIIEGDKKIYVAKNKSPLVLGVTKDEKFFASDVTAINDYTNEFIFMDDGEIGVIDNEVTIYKDMKETPKKIEIIEFDLSSKDKQGYKHYMLKEINEEPIRLEKTLIPYIEDLSKLPNLKKYDEIHIIGCGSAMYAGMVGKTLLEEKAGVRTICEVASEYRYKNVIYDKRTLVILISQSGETADTIAALEKAKENNIDTLAIVNVKTSTIARKSDNQIFIEAGEEVAVATTKAYLLQAAVLSLLSLKLAYDKGIINDISNYLNEFRNISKYVKNIIDKENDYKGIVSLIKDKEDIFFIGRKLDYAMCLEGSLKLKEVSYIHSEAYQAGELKHGTISLIEDDMPVFSIITDDDIADKTYSNLLEVASRGATTILITKKSLKQDIPNEILVDDMSDFTISLLVIPILQIIAYYTALERGCDIDKPKNLAKSVTVE